MAGGEGEAGEVEVGRDPSDPVEDEVEDPFPATAALGDDSGEVLQGGEVPGEGERDLREREVRGRGATGRRDLAAE